MKLIQRIKQWIGWSKPETNTFPNGRIQIDLIGDGIYILTGWPNFNTQQQQDDFVKAFSELLYLLQTGQLANAIGKSLEIASQNTGYQLAKQISDTSLSHIVNYLLVFKEEVLKNQHPEVPVMQPTDVFNPGQSNEKR